jgi:hypothetical protein
MGHPRRYYEHGSVYWVTNRLAEGLPFVPCNYINNLLYGILAKAHQRTPSVVSCGWLFLANHFHALLLTDGDPQDVAEFMNYVDGEIAKVVCRILGKRHYKVWAQRYNAARLLRAEDVMERMAYMYANPSTANLVESIEDWPGVSTWNEFIGGETRYYKRVKPSEIPRLPNGAMNKSLRRSLDEAVEEISRNSLPLQIDSFAWKHCFEASRELTNNELREDIIKRVRGFEQSSRRKRIKKKKSVVGAATLVQQNPHRSYKPKSFGRRVFCISSCPELRAEFIALYKDFCYRCEQVWKDWKAGSPEPSYPPGAFVPPQAPHANVLPFVT